MWGEYLLNGYELRRLIERKAIVTKEFMKLMNEQPDAEHPISFDNAISYGTGDVNKVRLRFSRIAQLIDQVLA